MSSITASNRGPSRSASPARRTAGLWRKAAPYLTATLLVCCGTAMAEALFRLTGLTRLSPVFLGSVLVVAITLGARPALMAAILAFWIYNFYLVEPRFTFTFETEDFLTLLLFLSVALLTGQLAGRAKDEAVRTKARARTLGVLFEASRELSSTGREEELRHELAGQIAQAVRGEAEVVLEGEETRAVDTPAPPTTRWNSRPLVVDGAKLGAARWRSADLPEDRGGELDRLVEVLVDLGAAAIARSRLAAEQARIDSLARTERLRVALLSSVSHDFRTPLTAILTSATSLRTFGHKFEPAERDDLLSTIEEEAERLNSYVANLLSFTKLEAGSLQVELTAVSGPDVLKRLTKRFERRTVGRTLSLVVGEGALDAWGDPFLLEQALANVLENAVRYAPPATTIELHVRRAGPAVVIDIIDEGPGVPVEQRALIFEKFYRAPGPAHQQGTGLGLSIARGMVEAMGGGVEATNRPDEGAGLCVRVSLPAAA